MAESLPKPDPEKPPEGGFSRWRWWKRWFGRRSERTAAKYLRRLGYRIIAANVSDPTGELDLLAIDGDTLVIVEVRSTSSALPDALTQVAATVDARKQRKISDATARFLARRGLLGKVAVRYDVLAIAWPERAREPAIRHIRHAFESTGRFQFFT